MFKGHAIIILLSFTFRMQGSLQVITTLWYCLSEVLYVTDYDWAAS